MLDKSKLKEQTEELFGFQSKGELRVISKLEKPILAVDALFTAFGALYVFLYFVNSGGALFYMIVSGAMLAALIFASRFVFNLCVSGVKYDYEADDNEFRLYRSNRAKKPPEVYYYSDVEDVIFEEMSFFGYVRGFKVTVVTKYRRRIYKCIFGRNKQVRTPEGIPFYILKERAGTRVQRNTAFRAEAPEIKQTSNNALSFSPVQSDPCSVTQSVDASGIAAKTVPNPRAVAPEDASCGTGTFRCACENENKLSVLNIAGIVTGCICALTFDMLKGAELTPLDQYSQLFNVLSIVFQIIIAALTAGEIVILIGKKYSYEAGSTEFTVRSKNLTEVFEYTNILDIRYEPFKILFLPRGFTVTIKTSIREARYWYIFPIRTMEKSPNASVFFLLELNSGFKKG